MGAMEFAEHDGFRHFPKPQHEGNDDGINTGLSLFDLHRWRRSFPRGKYTQFVKEAYNKYGEHFVFPTQVPRVPVPGPSRAVSRVIGRYPSTTLLPQDFFNVWLGAHPEHYYNLPCEWNIRDTLVQMRLDEAGDPGNSSMWRRWW